MSLILVGSFLAIAIGVRALALFSYSPALLIQNTHDSADYIAAARKGFFSTGDEPSGYPNFLRLVHAISHDLWFTIAVQHALGVLAGLLLLLAVRRLGAPLLLALVPAAVLWLNGDELFLEQAPLSEALFTFFLALAVYAAVRTLEGSRRWAGILGASAVGLSVTRTVGIPAAAVLVGLVAVTVWRMRLSRRLAVVALVCAMTLTAGYSVATRLATGGWSPLAHGAGWNLYMRAAEFADCRKFTPPQGTGALCDPTPSDNRPGPGYYRWSGGPAVRTFGVDRDDHIVGEFALTAVTHQPGPYLAVVATDLVRYVTPSFGRQRLDDFGGPATVRFPTGTLAVDPAAARQVSAFYGSGNLPTGRPPPMLHDYQRYVRFSGWMLVLATVLGLAGAVPAAGRKRWSMLLMVAVGMMLIFVPALTAATWRYAVPAEGPLVCAAAVGAWVLGQRSRTVGASRPAGGARTDARTAKPRSTTIRLHEGID